MPRLESTFNILKYESAFKQRVQLLLLKISRTTSILILISLYLMFYRPFYILVVVEYIKQ